MTMAVDYVRVVYRAVSACIDLDGKIRTYSDIAEAAAVKHVGKKLAEDIPMGALALHGPVAFTEDLSEAVLASLRGLGKLSFGRVIDRTLMKNGAWFLLEIGHSSSGWKTLC
jgi:hypothetical protein